MKGKKITRKGILASFVGNVHRRDGQIVGGGKIDLDRKFGSQQVYMTKHHVNPVSGGVSQAANLASNGALVFTIADISDSANFLAVFDEYRIIAVKCKFIPRQNAIPAGASATYIPGYLVTALDFDDSASVAIASLLDYNTAIETGAFEEVTRIFRPKISTATYGGGVLTNYQQITPGGTEGWIDNSSTTVAHNGCKWAIRAGAAAQTLLSIWDIEETLYVQWRMSI